MTRYGVDACTECGAMTELLLAPLSSRLLALPVPAARYTRRARATGDLSPIERLKMQKGIGVFRQGAFRGR